MAHAVAAAPGIVMMLGAVDVGKTTTATHLADAAFRSGMPAAVVDTDTGQSDLGPPAAIGWGPVHAPLHHMAEVALAGLWFVGDTSPRRVYRYVVDGTVELTGLAQRLGARIVVVDTTGWVHGAGAVTAKLLKIRRLAPRHIVAIQHDREVEPILAHVPPGTTIHRLRPAPSVRSRSMEERRALRERRFAAYFAGSGLCVLDLGRVAPERPATYMGRTIPPSRVVADVPPDALRGLLVGLADRRGTIMAMGTVAEVDPALQRLLVAAPGVSPHAVRFVQWGRLRVTPAGREAGRLSDRHGVSA